VSDGYVFGNLARALRVLIPTKMRDARLIGASVQGLAWQSYFEARLKAYAPHVIAAAFRDRGALIFLKIVAVAFAACRPAFFICICFRGCGRSSGAGALGGTGRAGAAGGAGAVRAVGKCERWRTVPAFLC